MKKAQGQEPLTHTTPKEEKKTWEAHEHGFLAFGGFGRPSEHAAHL